MVQVSKIVKWFFIIAGTMLATLLALCVFAFWYMSSGIFGVDSFDKQAWHKKTTNEQDATCYRGGMAKDIIDRLLSSKATREDVVSLLGSPDGNSTENSYRYVLGMCSGFGFDYDSLHVYFDGQGYVSHAKIMQH